MGSVQSSPGFPTMRSVPGCRPLSIMKATRATSQRGQRERKNLYAPTTPSAVLSGRSSLPASAACSQIGLGGDGMGVRRGSVRALHSPSVRKNKMRVNKDVPFEPVPRMTDPLAVVRIDERDRCFSVGPVTDETKHGDSVVGHCCSKRVIE